MNRGLSLVDMSAPPEGTKQFDEETALKLRLEAIGLVPALPQDEDEALGVLAYAREFILNFAKLPRRPR